MPLTPPTQILCKHTEMAQAPIGESTFEGLALRISLKNYVKKSLGEELAEHITYCSIKNNTLFIILDHTSALSLYRIREKELLDNLRKWYKDLKKEAPKAYWTKVKAQLSNDFKIFAEKPSIQTQDSFLEAAKGDFKIECSNPKLKEKFEKIREAIKANQNKRPQSTATDGPEVVVMGEF
ncbi:hypothetical protein BKH46_09225 [Helicobacter sp. 12S02634-8]|uniref:DciA family protein n=1 Tax=Helicobacter sp. 12S02634-8 TaxID=1476199 RepID=UPI000BA5809B|nr:DciA family protein [Helicobacter sp. 12S02634-8]PAF45550.1 hypothetical protein BKH46_09225 [Helicobacter sp. 12S02634-8]